MSIGLKLLAALIDSDTGMAQYAKLRVDDSMFMGEAEVEVHKVVYAHAMKYGKLPSRQTLKDAGIILLPPPQPEPPQFYFDKCRERRIHYQLKATLKTVESDLNDDKPIDALGRLSSTMSLCQMLVERDRLIDLAQEALPMVKGEYKQRQAGGDDYGLKLGWPTFDGMTGGLGGGDLITIVGRPGAGKTYLMLNAANTAWRSGKIPLFVSMEMKPLQIMQRASAMLAKFPITGIKHAALESKQESKLWASLAALQKSKFPYWVIDGALTSTVDDVILMAKQLQPGAVFVDGAYLLRTPHSRVSRWERLTENAERLKGELAEAMDLPVCLSYQFNREVKKGAKPQSVGLENIAYTDALGQLSSVVLGMLQEQGTETLTQRRIEILKGRNGEQGSFLIRWIFDQGPHYMDFSEIEPPKEPDKQDDLHYV